jgi:hypothetical protein
MRVAGLELGKTKGRAWALPFVNGRLGLLRAAAVFLLVFLLVFFLGFIAGAVLLLHFLFFFLLFRGKCRGNGHSGEHGGDNGSKQFAHGFLYWWLINQALQPLTETVGQNAITVRSDNWLTVSCKFGLKKVFKNI